jgi:aminoglycoside phosphotransferase (APT) family kinase protein
VHEAINAPAVTDWMKTNVTGARAPFSFDVIAAGGSNLTFQVEDAAGRLFVLRRPPAKVLLATAHDVTREHRIMSALAHSDVPVPNVHGLCADTSVTGAPFYVMDFVEGRILRAQADASDMDEAACLTATQSLIDTQHAFHTIDLEATGLADLARHDSYVERQLSRWYKQYDRGRVRDLPLLEELHARLSARIPAPSGPPGLAHGDYRFDNTILGADHQIAAVLDWELCTIGDPLADFSWSMMYWNDPGDTDTFLESPPTLHPAFIRRDEMINLYAETADRDVSDLPWFTVFCWWKMACIIEGVHARALAGASGGGHISSVESIAERVDRTLAAAEQAAMGVV